MGILNVTPDSFSDGGTFLSPDAAVARAERMIADGADIIDIGGESTRPGSASVDPDIEIKRVVPVIERLSKTIDIPISVDTTKPAVAAAGIAAGAEIINDISGLRWEPELADIAAQTQAGLVLMHSRGSFDELHSQPPVDDILAEVTADLTRAITMAKERGVSSGQIAIDVGIGFGKSFEQNLLLLAKLDQIVNEFPEFPMIVGGSRKSFIGKILGDAPIDHRLGGSLAAAILVIQRGAKIVRVHDVRETVQALTVLSAIEAK
ncbi:MAG: dihydropteroate synthase [Acidobacteria bacterium]|nr:dihydropteroate synthase [Acidobacteriota bacterium]